MHVTTTDIFTRTQWPTPDQLWQTARLSGFPAAIWRLPNADEKHLILQTESALAEAPVDFDELSSGFVLSRFDNFDHGNSAPFKALFLRADLHFSATAGGTDWQPANEASASWWSATGSLLSVDKAPASDLSAFTTNDNPAEKARFEEIVAEAVSHMKKGGFRKVVASRTKTITFGQKPDVLRLFDRLCQAYPTAFISAVWLPEYQQIWISATPERLVSVDRDGFFRTLSLAGTQSAFHPDGTEKLPAEALWSQKEIEEQALVSRYIIECFKKIRLREYLEEGPRTIQAGNLMHLGSHFTVNTRAVHYPQLGTVMLRLLHPTSAVCGMPRAAAFQFIQQHEGYDREFYSGFLGPVNIQEESHLFVHIRCLKLENRQATLYAGAGLTEDSVPEREWQETEMKCQTLLRCLTVS
ncbi:chorismate-binding protein [Arsenicibacter rosenii]|uniref:isochorismate synthase n=1 Tax=Arsenicibacter rosenii TaxID=1750698 RepID=A0A1S2VEP7_9BACT|nr:chorismate-binding protein [Arsenicibacter rosenii]OIN56755.1 chloride transporter [Arsenicibacter rosenii]